MTHHTGTSQEPARRPRGFGVRQSSAALFSTGHNQERQRTAALHDAVACQFAPPRSMAAEQVRKEQTASPQPRKRILVLNAGGEWYGSDKVLFYALSFLSRWHDCLVVLPFAGILDRRLAEAGIACRVQHYAVMRRVFFTPWKAPRWAVDFAFSTARLLPLVRRFDPDLIYSNSVSVLEGAVLSRWLGRRHLWHLHDILDRPAWLSAVLRWLPRHLAEDTLCVSQAVARHIGPGRSVKTVHNGIPAVVAAPRFRPVAADSPFTVGVLGRFSAHKGQLDLLRALDYLRRHRGVGDRLRVRLVGGVFADDERWRDQAKAFVAARGLGRVVRIEDFTETIETIYPELDLLVLPTIQADSFPTVALEAMSCGIPVVAYRNGGVEEMLDGDPDCLVDLRDHRALGRTIQRFSEDDRLRLDKARHQYRTYLARFTLEHFEQRFFEATGLGPYPGQRAEAVGSARGLLRDAGNSGQARSFPATPGCS